MSLTIKEISGRPGNKFCADCDMRGPTWASVNIGVLVCLNCSGIHRALGTHISFVQSTTLDDKGWKTAKGRQWLQVRAILSLFPLSPPLPPPIPRA